MIGEMNQIDIFKLPDVFNLYHVLDIFGCETS